MKKTLQGFGLGFFILLAIMILVGLPAQKPKDLVDAINILVDGKKEWPNPLNDVGLVDNKAIYANDIDSQVDKLYVTVLPPSKKGAVTFQELNNVDSVDSSVYLNDASDPTVEIFFEGEKPGKNSSYKANATMELRGQSQRRAPLKSYKIKLFDDTPEWAGFSTINLNKHYVSALKIENKLAFDYFEILPDIVSLRTRFVRLYVRDLSSDSQDKDFKDYGLFTLIEQPNKKFLANHHLDKNGHLYKVENFEFFRHESSLKLTEDTTFDGARFEQVLEVRGNEDHKKLIEMLAAVNDFNQDINEVVDKHFDRDNLMTWLAANILFDNFDTNSRNFLLYSPLNSDKWFFLPWDYDGMQMETSARSKWQKGLANYWGMSLFNRLFKDPANAEALGKKIEETSRVVNQENTGKLLNSYYDVIKENLFVPPDVNYLKLQGEQYLQKYNDVGENMERNKKYFFDSLENPMPFFLGTPTLEKGEYVFNWDSSFDLQNDDLTYDFVLSKDSDFNIAIASYKGLKTLTCNVNNLKPGQYFYKVIARDSKGNWQHSFDKSKDDSGKVIHGAKQFIVE